ncbi:MAG: glycerophosphodiester phosphodiesterase, partial [Desulfobacteraceae bacterium]|nr:glycerophosphodiester phosphodiesterase [Desulfobacteraceae bacterium]
MVDIIAHRGARSIAPENTLIAAQKGYDLGATLWETDVSVTKDGHLILFHDESLVRTTDVLKKYPQRKTYLVKDFTLEEIQNLDASVDFIENDPFGQIKAGTVTKK